MSAVRVGLVVAAAVAIGGGIMLALPDDDDADRLRTSQQAEDSQVVRDGSRVTATGSVVAIPGRAVRFCAPVSRVDVGYPPGQEPAPEYCELGVDAEGVDLAALRDRRAQVTAAQQEIRVGSDEGTRLGVMGGSGEGAGDDLQVEVGYDAVMVTEELEKRAQKHPRGPLVLRPWLLPVR